MLLGIVHSAISVADTDLSTRFFAKRGLKVGMRTLNRAPAQVALDGIEDVTVDVVPMMPIDQCPHLELLQYQAPPTRKYAPLEVNDIAAWLLRGLVCESDVDALIKDPAGQLPLLRHSVGP